MVNFILSLVRKRKTVGRVQLSLVVAGAVWFQGPGILVAELRRRVKHELSRFTVKHLIDNLRNSGPRNEVMRLTPHAPHPWGPCFSHCDTKAWGRFVSLFLFGKWCQCAIPGDLYVSGAGERQTKGYFKARTEFISSNLPLMEPLRWKIFLDWVSCLNTSTFVLSQRGENHASCFMAEDFKCLRLGTVGLSFVIIVCVLLPGTTNKSSTPYFCKEKSVGKPWNEHRRTG